MGSEAEALSDGKYYVDEFGNMMELEEVDNEVYIDEDFDSQMPQLVFIDEKKELIVESNCFGKTICRMTLLVVVVGIGLIWFQDYVI